MLPKEDSRGHYSMDSATKEEGEEMMKSKSSRRREEQPDKKKGNNDVRGECEYCDPNFMNLPGIEEALKGYDVPSGNPNPGS